MTAQSSYLLLTLIAYAAIGRFALVGYMIARGVRVPWLTAAVPLHLFQRSRERQDLLGGSHQWWVLSTDLAVLAILGLVFVSVLKAG